MARAPPPQGEQKTGSTEVRPWRETCHPFAPLLGSYILIWGIIDLALTIWYEPLNQTLWFCNIFFPLLGLCFIMESSWLSTGVLSAALSVQWPWVVDFVVGGTTGWYPFNVTTYMNGIGHGLAYYVEFNHLLLIPFAIIACWLYGIHKRGFLSAYAIGIPMLIASFLFSTPDQNINCMQYLCGMNISVNPFHPILFMMGTGVLTAGINKTLCRYFTSPEEYE